MMHLKDGDQHNAPKDHTSKERFSEGEQTSHHLNGTSFFALTLHSEQRKRLKFDNVSTDPKDQYSLGNRANAEKKQEREEKAAENAPRVPATRAAESHGNKPSKGAIIDEQLAMEDEAELAKKNKA